MFVFSSILLKEVVSLIVKQEILWVLSSVSTFTGKPFWIPVHHMEVY